MDDERKIEAALDSQVAQVNAGPQLWEKVRQGAMVSPQSLQRRPGLWARWKLGRRVEIAATILVMAVLVGMGVVQNLKAGRGAAGSASPVAPPIPAAPATPQPSVGPGRRAVPDCFPYHDPRAQGPGPSMYGWALRGPSPLFPGANIDIDSLNWPVAAQKVTLLLVPNLENAMWYGRQPDLVQCLGSQAQVLAEVSVAGGHWQWTGKAPSARPGERPTLVAVDNSGRYFLQGLGVLSDKGVNPPFRLTAAPAGGASRLPAGTAVPEAILGEPMLITGSDLPLPDGPVRIGLGFHGWNGTDDPTLGMAQVRGGHLEATLTVPRLVTADGGETAVLTPSTYSLEITPPQRPFTYMYTIPLRLLPDSQDQATLAAFWSQEYAKRGLVNTWAGFPRSGGLAPCRLNPAVDRPDGTCETQISAVDPRHDPAAPGAVRTITLTAAWTEGDVPRSHVWSVVVDQKGNRVGSKESGDPLPPQ